jgi:signal peptidase I
MARGRKNSIRTLLEYGLTIFAAVLIALFIRFYLLEAYRIPSAAMRPALLPGDTIFVSKMGYAPFPWAAGGKPPVPGRGEVVIYSLKQDPTLNFIKRVIGVPGDTVMMREGHVILNGKPLRTSKASDTECFNETTPESRTYVACKDKPALEDFGPEKVPAGSVFVIGDLRAQGKGENRKTRHWGIVPVSSIKGKALWIWLSLQPREINEPRKILPHVRWSRMFRSIQ